MSKAAHHQAIRRDDFMKTMPMDRSAGFQTPSLPSLQDVAGDEDDDHEGDAAVKLHPVDIGVLKELMWKKVQKIAVVSGAPKKEKQQSGAPSGGLNSRQSSKVSIKSAESSSRSKL